MGDRVDQSQLEATLLVLQLFLEHPAVFKDLYSQKLLTRQDEAVDHHLDRLGVVHQHARYDLLLL